MAVQVRHDHVGWPIVDLGHDGCDRYDASWEQGPLQEGTNSGSAATNHPIHLPVRQRLRFDTGVAMELVERIVAANAVGVPHRKDLSELVAAMSQTLAIPFSKERTSRRVFDRNSVVEIVFMAAV